MRVVICAAGDGSRWRNYLGTRKHFASMNGEPVIARTIRLLRARGVQDILVTVRPQDRSAYESLDATLVEKPAGLTNNEARLATADLWSPFFRTLIIWGDTFFTESAMDKLLAPRVGWTLYARLKASEVTGKPGPEIFAVGLDPGDHHEYAEALGKHAHAKWSSWVTYLEMVGQPVDLDPKAIMNAGRCVEIDDDGTDDFDFPDDYERFMSRYLGRSSRRVKAADFETDWFRARMADLKLAPKLHRKPWEFCSIAQAYLDRYGRGGSLLGFGVGKEPLPAWFAARGATVVATDRPDPGVWLERQHARGREELRVDGICTPDEFEELVSFEPADMNAIPERYHGRFDMTWSASCFEHLGGVKAGLRFFEEQMKCLKPGGIALHTTEYNASSNDKNIDTENLCFFRQRDLLTLTHALARNGDRLWPIDLTAGKLPADTDIDRTRTRTEPHLILDLGGIAFTSVLLIGMRGYDVKA